MILPLLLTACRPAAPPAGPAPEITLAGPLLFALGDPRPERAVLWARAGAPARLRVQIEGPAGPRDLEPVDLDAQTFAAKVPLTGLSPDTSYRVRLRAEDLAVPAAAIAVTGAFTTPPAADEGRGLRAIVAGDLGGQGWCRDPERGYDIFRAMKGAGAQLFIANGDMIYADGACPPLNPGGGPNRPGDFPSIGDPAVDWAAPGVARGVLDAHWLYNRSDPAHRAFLAEVPMIAQWDDHEVINDFGAPWQSWRTGDPERAGYAALVEAGRAAFFDWNPIERHPDEPGRIYRAFRWGAHLEIFVLDARSYRDPNPEPDGEGRTLLGAAQRQWLIDGLIASEATWKLVSSDVPISIPTGSAAWRAGRDGWASGDPEVGASQPEGEVDRSAETGFESELAAILSALDAADVQNLLFVTTDVHFAQSLRYDTDADGDGDALVFHEFVSGPLNAWMGAPGPLDSTFSPTSLYAEGGLFNFLVLDLSADGAEVQVSTRGADGVERRGSGVRLEAR